MASIWKELTIDAPCESVWAALRDVGAVHERLLPGRVLSTRVDGELRVLGFPDGAVVRELIVDVDDEARRLAYAVVEARMPIVHHHASFQVFAAGADRARLVWITDVLPHSLAPEISARVELGADEMKRALERAWPGRSVEHE